MEFLMMSNANITPAIRHVVLWLTTDCNLSCSYCYRCDPDTHEVMSQKTVMAALELAAKSGQPFHVQMAGGEPTLEPDLIEFVARKVREQGWPATLAVQTNAVAMTSDIAELLRSWGIGVGVSLDGPPQEHERLRGRFADTLRGLEVLENAGVEFGVTAVVSAENLNHLSRLALLLSRFKYARGLGFDLLVRRGRAASGWPPMTDTLSLIGAMKELVHSVAWINQRRTLPLILRELERMKTGAGAFCQAAAGASLAVHPDGRLYPCGQTMGGEDVAMGNVQNPDFTNLRSLGRYELRSAQCAGCPLEGHCPGECPSRLKYNGSKGHELACAMLRGLASGLKTETNNSHKFWDYDHVAA